MKSRVTIIIMLWGITLFSQENIEELKKRLGSSDLFVKNSALNEAIHIYDKALPLLPQLLNILDDDNNQNAYLAVKVIGHIGKEARKATQHLIKIVEQETDIFLRHHAIVALGLIGDKAALSCLEQASKEKNMNIRSATILSLHSINPPNFLQIIKPLAKDTQIPVQMAILGSLSHRKQAPETTEILLTGLKHSDENIQFHATQILELTSQNINKVMPIYLELLNSKVPKIVINVLLDFANAKKLSAPALPNILKLLKKKHFNFYIHNVIVKIGSSAIPIVESFLGSSSAYERQQAIILLSKLKQIKKHLPTIVKMGIEDADKSVRLICVNTLNNIEFVPNELKNYIAISIPKSIEAIMMVGKLKLVELVPILQKQLQTDNKVTKKIIYETMGKLALVDNGLVSNLISGLQQSQEIQKVAILSIGKLKEKGLPAVEKLTQIARNTSNPNYISAIIVLGQIGTEAKSALPYLNKIFQENKAYIDKHHCSKAMSQMGNAAAPCFINGLKSSQVSVRKLSIKALKKMSANQEILIAIEDMLLKEQNKMIKKSAYSFHKQLKKHFKNKK